MRLKSVGKCVRRMGFMRARRGRMALTGRQICRRRSEYIMGEFERIPAKVERVRASPPAVRRRQDDGTEPADAHPRAAAGDLPQ